MGRTRFSGPVKSTGGFEIGAEGGSPTDTTIIDSSGNLYQAGTLVTASAAELNITDGLLATAAEINAVADNTGKVVDVTSSTIVLSVTLHGGARIIALNRASGVTATLPSASGSGNVYTFFIVTTATSNAHVIVVKNTTDVMDGSLNIQQDTDTDGTSNVWRADVGDDTMTFAGAATTGGIVGGKIVCTDYAAGFWSCIAYTQSGGGAKASPFSATV